jgi:hypothetical protein
VRFARPTSDAATGSLSAFFIVLHLLYWTVAGAVECVHLPLPNIEIQLNLMAEARAILPTAPDRHRAAINFQHEVMKPFRPGTQKARQE